MTGEAVLAALEASIYWGGLAGGGLAAIGDEVGMVLIAPVGRGWYPIGLPALPVPTTIVAEGSRHTTTRVPGGPYVVETVAGSG